MSIVTSKSTMLSILKGSNSKVRTSVNRVRFQLPKNIREIFLQYKRDSNSRDYEDLVCIIRDSEISDTDLLALINEARNCTSLLNYELRLFVQAMILVRWTDRGESVVRAYQEFITDLVSAHSSHTKVVIDQLIKLFLNVQESDWVDFKPTELVINQLNNVHLILHSTLITIPLSQSILIDSISHNFPYINAPPYKQISYVYNILRIVQYQPDLRVNILQTLLDKLIFLDVHSPEEEVLQYEETHRKLLYGVEVSELEKAKVSMSHPLAEVLDAAMDLTFRYIRNECYVDKKLQRTKCRLLYNDIMVAFETVILPTHACHHVQFLLFYLCSFDAAVAQDFMKFLWRQVATPSVSPVIRQYSVAYLCSFLAKADFVSLGHLKNYLTKLGNWIHNYLTNVESASNFHPDYKRHSVFYSVCQGLFYLIAFRHTDLVDSSVKLKFLQSLNLPKIISCKLNPLKFCLPTVVENFAAVTRACQLAYCYTIMENNARTSMRIMGKGGQLLLNSVVDMYFPFDSCFLLRISRYIVPLYREYKSVLSQETKLIKKERLYSGNEDEDDFIKEESLQDHLSYDGIP